MKVIDCPYCAKLNPPSQFICLRCETSLTRLPEREVDGTDTATLQDIIDRRQAPEFIDKLKREYGPSEVFYKDGRAYSLQMLSDKIPFKTTHFRKKCLDFLLGSIILLFLFYFDLTFSNHTIHVGVKSGMQGGVQNAFIILVLSFFAYTSRGHRDSDVVLSDTHVKIGKHRLLWEEIHRIGLIKNDVTGANHVLLEIWYKAVPQVIKVRIPERAQVLEFRQVLEALCAAKNIPYFTDAKKEYTFRT